MANFKKKNRMTDESMFASVKNFVYGNSKRMEEPRIVLAAADFNTKEMGADIKEANKLMTPAEKQSNVVRRAQIKLEELEQQEVTRKFEAEQEKLAKERAAAALAMQTKVDEEKLRTEQRQRERQKEEQLAQSLMNPVEKGMNAVRVAQLKLEELRRKEEQAAAAEAMKKFNAGLGQPQEQADRGPAPEEIVSASALEVQAEFSPAKGEPVEDWSKRTVDEGIKRKQGLIDKGIIPQDLALYIKGVNEYGLLLDHELLESEGNSRETLNKLLDLKDKILKERNKQEEAPAAPREAAPEEARETQATQEAARLNELKQEQEARVRRQSETAPKKSAERYGFKKEPSTMVSLGMIANNAIGSTFGYRVAWEAPKLAYDYYKNKGIKSNIAENTIKLLKDAQVQSAKREGLQISEKDKTFGESGIVKARIENLNSKLKEAILPAKEKMALRKEMAGILKEYRKRHGDLEKAQKNKVGSLLDLYINNSKQTVVVAREAVNTLSIMAMAPWLRSVAYTALVGVEKSVAAANEFEKAHFREEKKDQLGKLGKIAKALTVDSAMNMYNGLIGNFFNKKVSKVGTVLGAASALGNIMRFVGLVEFESQLQLGNLTMAEGAQNFWSAIGSGHGWEAIKQGGENWLHNSERILSYFGITKNPDTELRRMMAERKEEVETAQARGDKAILLREEAEARVQAEEMARAQEQALVAEKLHLEEMGKMKEIATIHRGEGITHVFTRQIENDPEAFGFKGDLANGEAVHRWAQHQAYLSAIKNHYINPETGAEVRFNFDPKHPAVYYLNPETGGATFYEKPNVYEWTPAEPVNKAAIEFLDTTAKGSILGREFPQEEIDKLISYRFFGLEGKSTTDWNMLKEASAERVMAGEFRDSIVGGAAGSRALDKLQEYMLDLQSKTGIRPTAGEDTLDYLKRTFPYSRSIFYDPEIQLKAAFKNIGDKVVDVYFSGTSPKSEGLVMLKNNYGEILTNRLHKAYYVNVAKDNLAGEVAHLWRLNRVAEFYNKLGDSPYSQYLNGVIKSLRGSILKNYGPVLN